MKPTTIEISCADDNIYWGDIDWSSWGPTSATGTGFYAENYCVPSCAAGSPLSQGYFDLMASAPVTSGGYTYFTKLTSVMTTYGGKLILTSQFDWSEGLAGQSSGWAPSGAMIFKGSVTSTSTVAPSPASESVAAAEGQIMQLVQRYLRLPYYTYTVKATLIPSHPTWAVFNVPTNPSQLGVGGFGAGGTGIAHESGSTWAIVRYVIVSVGCAETGTSAIPPAVSAYYQRQENVELKDCS